MSERNGFRAGVPCWIDTWQPDAEAAVGFYTELFGWEAEGGPVSGSSRMHFMCTLRGRDVAAIGSPAPEGMPPTWDNYIWVDDVDATAAKVKGAGGSLVLEPAVHRRSGCPPGLLPRDLRLGHRDVRRRRRCGNDVQGPGIRRWQAPTARVP